MLQTKLKWNKEQELKESPIKEKRKVDKLRKLCNRQEKLLIKINKLNTFNKRQKNHLSSTPDSSLSIQLPSMPKKDSPVLIPTLVSP